MDPVHKAVIRTLEYGSEPKTWKVPENASIQLADRDGDHLLAGAVICGWSGR